MVSIKISITLQEIMDFVRPYPRPPTNGAYHMVHIICCMYDVAVSV